MNTTLRVLATALVLVMAAGCNRQGPDVPRAVGDDKSVEEFGDGVQPVVVNPNAAKVGAAVDDRDLRPGDLLFFDTEGRGRVSHVGIYLGDDQFISANSYLGRVSVDRLRSDRYWGPRYLWARRVLSSPVALGR